MADPAAYARAQIQYPTQNWINRCLVFVRTALGIGAGAPSAISAWTHAGAAHQYHDGNPPPNVPVFWGGGDGHVALSAGNGMVYSTDIHGKGTVALVPISEITQKWGKQYLGWTDTLNGQQIPVSGGTAADMASQDPYLPTVGLESQLMANVSSDERASWNQLPAPDKQKILEGNILGGAVGAAAGAWIARNAGVVGKLLGVVGGAAAGDALTGGHLGEDVATGVGKGLYHVFLQVLSADATKRIVAGLLAVIILIIFLHGEVTA